MKNKITIPFENQNSRRKPKQKRSIDKLNRVLDAATILMAEPNGEKLTTSTIAKKAGIAVGSVYQFYSNIGEIKEALLARVLSRISLVYQEVLENLPEGTPLTDICDALIDTTADFADKCPLIVKVITAGTGDKEFLVVKQRIDRVQLDMFTKVVVNAQDSQGLNETRRWLATLILIGDLMTYQVWTAQNKKDKARFVTEWKGIARYYLNLQNG